VEKLYILNNSLNTHTHTHTHSHHKPMCLIKPHSPPFYFIVGMEAFLISSRFTMCFYQASLVVVLYYQLINYQ
jgi:hypothetical protein